MVGSRKVINYMRKKRIPAYLASPNRVADIADRVGVHLTSQEVVKISNDYSLKPKKKPKCKYVITADPRKMGITYPEGGFKKTVYTKEETDFYKVRGFDAAKICKKIKKRK